MPSKPGSTSSAPGELRAEYRSGSIVLGLVMLPIVALCIWASWTAANETPPDLVAALGAAAGALLLFAITIGGLIKIPRRILLYDEGMLVEWLFGRGWFAWESITAAKAPLVRVQGAPTLQLHVETSDGRRLAFGDMPSAQRRRVDTGVPRIQIQELVACVMELSASARYQAALRRYNSGQPVDFKQLQISQAGISAKGQTLPWPMVADIQANGALMVVKAVGQQAPWRTFALHEAPNLDILPALIAQKPGERFSAFLADRPQPELEAAARARRRRRQMLLWAIFLLAIGANFAYAYGQYAFSARANYDRGTEALNRGDFATALRELDEAVRKAPTEGLYYIQRGRVHYLRNDYAAAKREFDAALALNPADSRAIGLNGMVMHQQGQFDEAIQMYNVALEAQPGLTFAYCHRGRSYAMLGRFDQARADFLRCRQSDDPALQAEATMLLSSLSSR